MGSPLALGSEAPCQRAADAGRVAVPAPRGGTSVLLRLIARSAESTVLGGWRLEAASLPIRAALLGARAGGAAARRARGPRAGLSRPADKPAPGPSEPRLTGMRATRAIRAGLLVPVSMSPGTGHAGHAGRMRACRRRRPGPHSTRGCRTPRSLSRADLRQGLLRQPARPVLSGPREAPEMPAEGRPAESGRVRADQGGSGCDAKQCRGGCSAGEGSEARCSRAAAPLLTLPPLGSFQRRSCCALSEERLLQPADWRCTTAEAGPRSSLRIAVEPAGVGAGWASGGGGRR